MDTTASLDHDAQRRRPKRLEQWLEPAVGLAVTTLLAIVLVVAAFKAGPLWRDETNSINLAQMPLREFWNNLRFDSCPVLWLLVLRGWNFLGLAGTDLGIRILGLLIGLLFLTCLWLCAKWIGVRGPVLSLALLGSLPMFINIIGANRAYGLALCLLLVNFGAVWRLVESPSKANVTVAGLAGLLFVHCVYYDVIFLYAMLSAAALVVIRRKEWRTLSLLMAIGAGTGLSMLMYLPVIRQSSHNGFSQVPFDFWTLWTKLGLAVTARSSARIPVAPGPEIWAWVLLLATGISVTVVIQGRWTRQSNVFHWSLVQPGPQRIRADLALFGTLSMLCGTVGYGWFLLRLRLPTEPWYYVEALTLCAISLEATLGATLQGLRPWGAMRLGIVVWALAWGATSVTEEAGTRRTNVDLIAEKLSREAREGDLVLVYGPWEGITFDRYYHGSARWMTIPPIDSHKLHRGDLVIEKMNDSQPLAPVLAAINGAFAGGHEVWVAGDVMLVRNAMPLPSTERWLGAYFSNWSGQVMAHILARSHSVAMTSLPHDRPVNYLEDVPLRRFTTQPSVTQ